MTTPNTDDHDGPTNQTPAEEIQAEEWIADVFLSLREGDTIFVNHREQSFTVTNREWDDRESGYWRYTIAAYGTEYHGYVQPADDHAGKSISSFTTDAGTTILPTHVTRDPDEGEKIVSDTRAEEWLQEAGIDVR